MENKESYIKAKIKNWFESTTIHGLPNISRSKNKFIKLMWTIFFLAFSIMGFYAVLMNFFSYFEYKANTMIELKKETKFEFPTITFCNLQICGFKNYDFNGDFNKYIDEESKKLSSPQFDKIEKKRREDNTKLNYFLAKEIFLRYHSNEDLNQVLDKNKTSINKYLISCSFMGKDCDENDFEFSLMGEFHRCFKFNSGKKFDNSFTHPKHVDLNKRNHGLYFQLYVGSQIECKSPLATTSGLAGYVHNKTYTITDDDYAIQVEPGTHSGKFI